jgi:hypothetical protein
MSSRGSREVAGGIQLEPLEQQILTCLSISWHSKNKITVLEAITSCRHMSATTAHRRMKRLEIPQDLSSYLWATIWFRYTHLKKLLGNTLSLT